MSLPIPVGVIGNLHIIHRYNLGWYINCSTLSLPILSKDAAPVKLNAWEDCEVIGDIKTVAVGLQAEDQRVRTDR